MAQASESREFVIEEIGFHCGDYFFIDNYYDGS